MGFVAAGQVSRQRVAGIELHHPGVNREVGKGAQRPNGQTDGSGECRHDRPGVLTPLRRFRKGTIAAGEQKAVARRWLLSAELAGVAWSFEA